jgi:hypothetical protein
MLAALRALIAFIGLGIEKLAGHVSSSGPPANQMIAEAFLGLSPAFMLAQSRLWLIAQDRSG